MVKRIWIIGLAAIVPMLVGGWAYRDYCETKRSAARQELAAITTAPYGPQRVVYHITEDGGFFDRRSLSRLGSLQNHVTAVGPGRLDARVILQGEGIYLLEHAVRNADLRTRIDALRREGVRFLICRNSLIDRGVAPSELYDIKPGDIVGAGVAEVSSLEAAGYVYLKL